jgi:hypothetical protein
MRVTPPWTPWDWTFLFIVVLLATMVITAAVKTFF